MYFAVMIKSFLLQAICFFSFSLKAQLPDSIFTDHLLVGTYTAGKSNGIYSFQFNNETGNTILLDSSLTADPSYLAVSPDNNFVFAVNELGSDHGSGKVISFSYDRKNGSFKKINEQPSGGDHPCYVAISSSGNWLLAGNYTGGNFSIFPVKPDGTIGKATSTINQFGSSINKERQEKPHVHCTLFSPDNAYILIADLGTDKIVVYKFDKATGKASEHSYVAVKPGGGPRHIEFHPNGKTIYVTEEMSGFVTVFSVNAGKLTQIQTINALPERFKGKISEADIHISADSKFLYCSNRGDANLLSIFSVSKEGMLKVVGYQATLGLTPRNFSIHPSGKFLLVANQDSNEIVVFKRNTSNGKLTDTGKRILTGNPVCLKWIR